ncbi:MAG TPA: hypothetical protein VMV79_04155 [Alphaproteobacteria bacterium]|nr:hypothetical protein [Alphaproteobacteria bacterium]
MSDANPSPADALAELASIRDYIAEVQRQMRAGQMPDMTRLEQRTADLCRIITESSSDIQQKCAPELQELAHQLDDCEKNMRSFFGEASRGKDPEK